jgi:beta-glucosidase
MPDISSIIQQMTLEEKAALCTGATTWSTTPIERLGVPQMILSDGPHGVRRIEDLASLSEESLPATCFPTASCLAASWDPPLLHTMGQALAEEAIALNVDVLLGPGTNMKRSPLGGRNFEYFSEDPFLAGEMACALIEGIQSRRVGTSLKHFAANNQESHRFVIDARVDERSLREIYLPAFEAAVKKARPWTVMCAYNKLNGTYCSENHSLLTDILKKEWGFEGLVVSDWGAVHDRVASLLGGLDLEMPGPKDLRVQKVIEAVRSGALDEASLDEAVRRILTVVFKAAATPKGGKSPGGGKFDVDAHHKLAARIASEGMVLLKNNGLLPLKEVAHIAVIGRSAEAASFQGGGSSHINATRVDVPFKELQNRAGGAELTYTPGYPADDSFDEALIDQAVALARSAEVAVLYISLPASTESEGYDRPDLDLTEAQVALIKAVGAAQPKTVVVLNNGAPVAMSAWIEDVAAVLEAWMMGQAGSAAIADVLFGRVNPSGKLAETYPLKLADTPAFLNWPGENGLVRYGEGMYIGYRWYEARELPVQFPFGFGLSYTTFAYSNARVSSTDFNDLDGLTLFVDVTNTGPVAGKEVLQVYVHDVQPALKRPWKELKGFAKVDLEPGKTKTVSIPLGFRAFAYYDPDYGQWVTRDGDFDLLIGASSADIRLSLTVSLHSTLNLPCILDRESTIREWLADPRGKVVVSPMFEAMRSQMGDILGDADGEVVGGMAMMEFMLEMPLLGVLHFQESLLPMPADDLLDNLLAQVHNEAPKPSDSIKEEQSK